MVAVLLEVHQQDAAALVSRTVASVPADGRGAVRTEHTETAAAQVMVPAVSPAGRLAYRQSRSNRMRSRDSMQTFAWTLKPDM